MYEYIIHGEITVGLCLILCSQNFFSSKTKIQKNVFGHEQSAFLFLNFAHIMQGHIMQGHIMHFLHLS